MRQINPTTYHLRKDFAARAEIHTVVGDESHPDFRPHVKFSKWDAHFSLHHEVEGGTHHVEGEKVKWVSNDKEIHFYELEDGHPEGGMEFEIILKSKPASNVIRFKLEHENVRFTYQPELTDEQKESGEERPENVIGSYSVYHTTKKHGHYKTGKIGHIFRPQIIDQEGKKIWGTLHIENGEMTVTVPQEFLDTAVYPIRHAAGNSFGYITQGASSATGSNIIWGLNTTGIVGRFYNGMSFYATQGSGSGMASQTAIYDNAGNIITNGTTASNTTNMNTGWVTIRPFTAQPTLSAIAYRICLWAKVSLGTSPGIAFDTLTNGGVSQSITYVANGWPNPATFVTNNNEYSIYVQEDFYPHHLSTLGAGG